MKDLNLIFKLGVVLSGLFFLVTCATHAPSDLKPFTSDGCSSFPDGTAKQKKLWLNCCVEHDKAYWMGGTYDERLQADKDLKKCVESVGKKAIAKLMLAGVRVGGSPYWPTQFRWGYGWNYPRGYSELTEEERNRAKELLEAYEKANENTISN